MSSWTGISLKVTSKKPKKETGAAESATCSKGSRGSRRGRKQQEQQQQQRKKKQRHQCPAASVRDSAQGLEELWAEEEGSAGYRSWKDGSKDRLQVMKYQQYQNDAPVCAWGTCEQGKRSREGQSRGKGQAYKAKERAVGGLQREEEEAETGQLDLLALRLGGQGTSRPSQGERSRTRWQCTGGSLRGQTLPGVGSPGRGPPLAEEPSLRMRVLFAKPNSSCLRGASGLVRLAEPGRSWVARRSSCNSSGKGV